MYTQLCHTKIQHYWHNICLHMFICNNLKYGSVPLMAMATEFLIRCELSIFSVDKHGT